MDEAEPEWRTTTNETHTHKGFWFLLATFGVLFGAMIAVTVYLVLGIREESSALVLAHSENEQMLDRAVACEEDLKTVREAFDVAKASPIMTRGTYEDPARLTFDHPTHIAINLVPGFDERSYKTVEFLSFYDDGTFSPAHIELTYDRNIADEFDGIETFDQLDTHLRSEGNVTQEVEFGTVDDRSFVKTTTDLGVVYYIQGEAQEFVYRLEVGSRYSEASGVLETFLETVQFTVR